ncbi:MAG TPA: hypothetical protein VN133_12585 [Humibacter sp.]|nr:hypothetical protein [Humibacter sp.]
MTSLNEATIRLQLARSAELGLRPDRALQRAVVSGALERVRRGVFREPPVPVGRFTTGAERYAARRAEYLDRVAAVVLTRSTMPVLSHTAALAVWDLPQVRPWPRVVDILVPPSSHLRSKNGVRVHRESCRSEDIVRLDRFLLTSPERTALDLARAGDVESAITVLDALLAGRHPYGIRTATDDLYTCLQAVTSTRGRRIAERAIAFADGRSGSPGESWSRIAIHKLGLPAPELQVRHESPRGGYYLTDFEWPGYHLIGEFDGAGKYRKDDVGNDGDAGRVVFEEKLREDDLRAEDNRVARWGWPEVNRPALLLRRLCDKGLPVVRRPLI